MSVALAVYGSHNASIGLAIDGKIIEILEVERAVGKKNASLFAYPPTRIEHPQEFLNWVKERFRKLYGVEHYDVLYREAIDDAGEEMLKTTFSADVYSGFNHHTNHAAATFYQSTHAEAIILSFDGGGDNGWFNMYHAVRGKKPVEILYERVNYGVSYSMVGHFLDVVRHEQTYFIGNLVYSGKIMALAGFGKVRDDWMGEFDAWYTLPARVDHIALMQEMLARLNIPLVDGIASPEDSKDLAATNQYAFEKHTIRLIQPTLDKYPNLPLHITGGSALNIIFNTRMAKEREVFVSPNPSDCGITVGMLCNHILPQDAIDITYAGPEVFDADMLPEYIQGRKVAPCATIVDDLVVGKIVGVVRGGCELGPRALGNRSILCNPTIPNMKNIINGKVKHRESFRPFAPVVRLEDMGLYFEWEKESRWMNYCPRVRAEYAEMLSEVMHIDGTARVQTVTREQNAWLYDTLTAFKEKSGCGVLLNTSFNVDGKPILNTYRDAFKVFDETLMGGLMVGDVYIRKHY